MLSYCSGKDISIERVLILRANKCHILLDIIFCLIVLNLISGVNLSVKYRWLSCYVVPKDQFTPMIKVKQFEQNILNVKLFSCEFWDPFNARLLLVLYYWRDCLDSVGWS